LCFLPGDGGFQKAREIVAQNLRAIPALPQSILGIEVIEVDAAALAHDLKSRASSLDNLDVIDSHRKGHRYSSLRLLKH
jgi:hypothetical protein